MGRILFWVLLGLLLYLAWRWWSAKQRLRAGGAGSKTRNKIGHETMVPCEVCGLNVPQSEAYAANGRWYCSDEHRRLGPG
jgi:uncharacterized protein